MLNYLEFILENKDQLRLYYSLKFRNILEKIKDSTDNEVADILLQAENNGMYKSKFTLIDVTDRNDFISFIQTNRIIRKHTDLKDSKTGILPLDINLSDKGSEFWEKARTEMAIGRWTRKVFTDVLQKSRSSMVLSNNELEEFVNQYKATYDTIDDVGLEMVEGEAIRHWYSGENYESKLGHLGSSCMRQSEKSSFFDIYVKNPQVCKLLILKSEKDNTKIRGRALIWKLTDGSYYQDRVYTHTDSDRTLFENWAREKDMKYYLSNSFDDITVQLGDFTYEKYPYMDTFVAYNPDTNQLKNDEDLWPGQGYYLLQNVNGGYSDYDVVWSDYDQEYIDRENAVLTVDDEWVSRSSAIYIESREGWLSINDNNVVWSDWAGQNFHIDDVVYSEIISDWIPTDDDRIIEIMSDEKDYVPKDRTDLYIVVDGKYYSRIHWVKDPYDDYELINLYEYSTEKKTFNTPQNRQVLMSKLEGELGKDDSKLKRKLVEIYLNNNYNVEEVKKEIENNKIFKEKIRGVYWGLSNKHKPTVESMIPILFASISSGNIQMLYSRLEEYGTDIKELFKVWADYDRRIVNLIYKFTESFDFDVFNEDVYKIWLYFNI